MQPNNLQHSNEKVTIIRLRLFHSLFPVSIFDLMEENDRQSLVKLHERNNVAGVIIK